jgi:lysophospholipase L1-like esterase
LVLAPGKAALDQHREARQLVLYYTLSRMSDPVIVIGDSIVEASTLPRSICGHQVVNAGLNGASTASDLGGWLGPALGGSRAASIIVSLGVNDALTPGPPGNEKFVERYAALLAVLAKSASRLAVIEIAPVEAQGRMTAELRDEVMRTVAGYNSALRDLAGRNGAVFVALPAMPKPHTIDGVHLNADGYQAWDKAVIEAAGSICG